MPNGGSDCCATCWFNRRNKGEAGYAHTGDPEPSHCDIRDLPIDDPFYTYCANHPHRTGEPLRTPIGPVYTGDSFGHREVWTEAIDNEEVRSSLLALLRGLPEAGENEYPFGLRLGEVVISELVRLNERRAIPELQRIATMAEGKPDRYGHTFMPLIETARAALAQFEGT